MPPVAPTTNHEELIAHYEDLRRYVLGEYGTLQSGSGLTLFLQQGMTAWLRACSQCAPPVAAPAQKPAAALGIVPAGLQGEVVRIVAAMLLGGHLEVQL